ncbi:MAG TPA: hypothetical protein PKN56_18170 [Leptospiraceae bacterium]|nr:hypothetical protein [Leptospiraceae bacterium]HMY66365.1 hypothetical protein [Leptospiraceae bacterium]HNI95841.1 hypothetical protein [Leptospiraceae bacterium]HNM04367.1 hypothetical protein [Leptospiraceae bacterium]HNN05493.1 hypothetical protein [Leptospiraceae bacterium]
MGIELLIPFFASVIIFLVFRKLDSSSFRLSQVKKLTSKLNEDINQTALDGIQSVKDATIDLEVTNKQAKKLILDLQSKTDETNELLHSLKNNKDYLDTILLELKDVVKLTNEIREEARFIQDGMDIIQNQKAELSNVNRDVSLIQSEVKELVHKFQDKLDVRTTNILESLAAKIVDIESLLEVKAEKVDESLKAIAEGYKVQLKEEVESMVDETVGKVELANVKLDDFNSFVRDAEKSLEMRLTRYKDNTDSISERIERLDLRLEEKADSVGEAVQARLSSFEKKFQERFESIFEQLSQNKEAFLSGVKMEIDLVRTEIESMSLETMTRRDEILTEARRQSETVLQNINSFFEKSIDAENRLLKTAELKKGEILKEIHRFENDFRHTSESFYSDADMIKNSVMKDLQNFESDLNKATSSIEHNTRERFNSLREELEESFISLHGRKKSEFLSEISAIDLKIKELARDTANKIKNVDDHFYDLKNALFESSKDIMAQVENEAAKITVSIDAEKSRTDQKLEFYAENWNLELERIKSRTAKDVDVLVQRLKDIHVEGKEVSDSIRTEFSNGRTQLDIIVKKAEESLNVHIDSIAEEIQSKVKKSQDEVEMLLGRLQKAGINLYEKQESLLSDYGERLYKDLQTKLEKVRFESEELLEDIQKAGMNLLEKQEEKIDRLNTTIDDRISRQLTVLLDKGQLQLDQLENRIASYVHEVKTNIEANLKNSKEDSDRQIAAFNSQIQKNFREIEKDNRDFIDSNRAEFEKAKEDFEKFRRNVESEAEKVARLKGLLLSEFQSEESRIKNTLQKLTGRISEIESYAELFTNTEKVIRESELTVHSMTALLERLKIEGDSVHVYMKNLDFLKNSKKEIETEMRMLETQKLRIEQVENELSRATSLCDKINERTEELHDKISTVTSIDIKLVEMSRMQEEMDSKLTEVKSLAGKMNEITQAVHNTGRMGSDLNEKLMQLHKELSKLESKEDELQNQINSVEVKASELAARNYDFKSIESKFDKVENLMMDLSTKHKQISTMQKRVDSLKTETEEMRMGLEEILEHAEEKFQKFSEILNQAETVTELSSAKSSRSSKSASVAGREANQDLIKRRRATVLSLYRTYDWSTETIAEKLNMEKSLVEAIVKNQAS